MTTPADNSLNSKAWCLCHHGISTQSSAETAIPGDTVGETWMAAGRNFLSSVLQGPEVNEHFLGTTETTKEMDINIIQWIDRYLDLLYILINKSYVANGGKDLMLANCIPLGTIRCTNWFRSEVVSNCQLENEAKERNLAQTIWYQEDHVNMIEIEKGDREECTCHWSWQLRSHVDKPTKGIQTAANKVVGHTCRKLKTSEYQKC